MEGLTSECSDGDARQHCETDFALGAHLCLLRCIFRVDPATDTNSRTWGSGARRGITQAIVSVGGWPRAKIAAAIRLSPRPNPVRPTPRLAQRAPLASRACRSGPGSGPTRMRVRLRSNRFSACSSLVASASPDCPSTASRGVLQAIRTLPHKRSGRRSQCSRSDATHVLDVVFRGVYELPHAGQCARGVTAAVCREPWECAEG